MPKKRMYYCSKCGIYHELYSDIGKEHYNGQHFTRYNKKTHKKKVKHNKKVRNKNLEVYYEKRERSYQNE